MSVETASLFVIAGSTPAERFLLVRRAPTKADGEPQSFRYVLQPAVNGKIKADVDVTPLDCIFREAEHEGGGAFAAFLRSQRGSIQPLPQVPGYAHVHCFAIYLTTDEAKLFRAGAEFCETLLLSAEEAQAIEAIDPVAHKKDGVPRDSLMMFPDHRLALFGLVTWMQG